MAGRLIPYVPTGSNATSGLDLNALVNSGGSVSLGGLGGFGGTGITDLTPQAATTNRTTDSSSNTSKTGSDTTRTTGTSTTASKKKTDKKNIDAQSLKILQDAIAGIAGGGNPLLEQIDATRGQSIAGTQSLIAGLDPNAAVARAGGRTAELSRQLGEGAIAQLLGSDEAGGFGGNALSQLLAQDAGIRTGEAQARVEEEAFNNAINQQLQGTSVLNQSLQGGSAVLDTLLNALSVAKGATETGTETVGSNTTTDEVANRVSSEQSATTGRENVTQSSIDPLEWAKLASTLAISGAGSGGGGLGGGPSPTEKALALFPALGGAPDALLASLSGAGALNFAGSAIPALERDKFNNLLQLLGG